MHFKLIFIYDMRFRSKFFFFFSAYGCPIVIAPFAKKAILPLSNCFCTFIKNRWSIFVWIYFQVLCVPLIYVSLCQCHIVPITVANFIGPTQHVTTNVVAVSQFWRPKTEILVRQGCVPSGASREEFLLTSFSFWWLSAVFGFLELWLHHFGL